MEGQPGRCAAAELVKLQGKQLAGTHPLYLTHAAALCRPPLSTRRLSLFRRRWMRSPPTRRPPWRLAPRLRAGWLRWRRSWLAPAASWTPPSTPARPRVSSGARPWLGCDGEHGTLLRLASRADPLCLLCTHSCAGEAAKEVSRLAFQRIRELQDAVEDSKLEISAREARLAQLEGQVASLEDRAAGAQVRVVPGGTCSMH